MEAQATSGLVEVTIMDGHRLRCSATSPTHLWTNPSRPHLTNRPGVHQAFGYTADALRGPRDDRRSVFVVVILMRRVPVPIMHVVTVWHRNVPAADAMHMVVPGVRVVPALFAFVEVAVAADVQMPVVDVVDVVAVRDRDMSAGFTVHVVVSDVLPMFG
jgi:hypothetical protein